MVTAEKTGGKTAFHRGERIRTLRELAGMSQREFGQRMGGKDQPEISRIEGSVEGFSKVSDIERAALVLQVPVRYLLDPRVDGEWLDPELAERLASIGPDGQRALLGLLKSARIGA